MRNMTVTSAFVFLALSIAVGTAQGQSIEMKRLMQDVMRGNHMAMYYLGHIYETGDKGQEKNIEEAVKWYEASSVRGNTLAMFQLGLIYKEGRDGLQPDPQKAYKWFNKAAEKGHGMAAYEIGLMYENDYYQKKALNGAIDNNLIEARKWYEKALNNGFIFAMDKLAVMYYKGLGGLQQDQQKAVELLEESSKQGSDAAQMMLAELYYKGETVQKDKYKAFDLYKTAALQGNAKAQDWVGVMCYNGEGGQDADRKEALQWYRKAADQNYPPALAHLGLMYYSGEGGLPQDKQKAIELMKKASDLGDENAYWLWNKWEGNLSPDGTLTIQLKKGKPPE